MGLNFNPETDYIVTAVTYYNKGGGPTKIQVKQSHRRKYTAGISVVRNLGLLPLSKKDAKELAASLIAYADSIQD